MSAVELMELLHVFNLPATMIYILVLYKIFSMRTYIIFPIGSQ